MIASVMQLRMNNSTQYTWAKRNAEFYNVDDPVWQPDNWVGEQTFLEMLQEYDVELRRNTTFVEGSDGIFTTVDGSGLRRISAIKLESGEVLEGKYFIDASYEGEVMIASGHVSYTYGRESQSQYNESLAGVTNGSIGQFDVPMYVDIAQRALHNSMLRWVNRNGSDPRLHIGEADQNLMAYSFRACLTKNESNMVPITAPPGYNPDDFELSRMYLYEEASEQQGPKSIHGAILSISGYPENKAMKYDACCGKASIGIDAVGLAVGYPNTTRAKRKEIYDNHKYYVQGLMWFWASDPMVPEDIRNEHKSMGLCKDEWPDNDHFPPQLYVREAARIVGDKVYTQNDRIEASSNALLGCLNDSIAIDSWAFDIHEMQRMVVTDSNTGMKMIYNEGLTSPSNGGNFFFEIPYYILLPKRKEMVNLAVPNCPSVSHVAFAAIREEPTLWQMGQAAGTAAGVALKHGVNIPLQDVSLQELQAALIEQETFVHWPPTRMNCSSI